MMQCRSGTPNCRWDTSGGDAMIANGGNVEPTGMRRRPARRDTRGFNEGIPNISSASVDAASKGGHLDRMVGENRAGRLQTACVTHALPTEAPTDDGEQRRERVKEEEQDRAAFSVGPGQIVMATRVLIGKRTITRAPAGRGSEFPERLPVAWLGVGAGELDTADGDLQLDETVRVPNRLSWMAGGRRASWRSR